MLGYTIIDFPSMMEGIEHAAKEDADHLALLAGFAKGWEDENAYYNYLIGVAKKHARKHNYHGDAYGWYIGQFLLAAIREDPTPEALDDP